jgi:uncharacterized membrane protein
MQLKHLPCLLVLVLFSAVALARPPQYYRVTAVPYPVVPDGGTQITGANNRGEFVGYHFSETDFIQRGFYWRDGQYTWLNDLVAPGTPYMEVGGINDRSEIVGWYSDPVSQFYKGFLLDRHSVRVIDGPAGAQYVFLNTINERGQILGASYDAEGIESRWIWRRGEITVVEQPFSVSNMNDRGVVSGSYYQPISGSHAAIWDDGEVTVIGPPFSVALSSNVRGQVVGTMNNNGASRAFLWERGTLTPLPALRADQLYSHAGSINRQGVIGGSTVVFGPTGTVNIATLWIDQQPIDVNTLIHPDDPLRPFVTLQSASMTARGDIIASGSDSRVPGIQTYLLESARR